MNNLYVLVDFNLNQIITPVDKLPSDWSNISGLDLLDAEKIKNLDWCENPNLGWFNINDKELTEYSIIPEWLEISKLKLKSLISLQRWERENEILTFEGKQLKLDDRTKLSLIFRSFSIEENEIINWKFLNGTYEISSLELIQIYNFTTSYIQNCFDIEYEFSKLVDNIITKEDLLNIDLNLEWPDTSI